MNLKFKVVAGFGAALVIGLTLGVLSFRKISRDQSDQRWVEHTHVVIEILDDLELRIRLMEDRSNASSSLGQSSTENDQTRSLVEKFKELTADNPHQQQALALLSPLIDRVLKEQSQQLDAGVTKYDQIESLIAQMKDEEQHLLAQRSKIVQQSSRRMKGVLLIGSAVALALLIGSAIAFQHEMSKRSRVQEELRRSEERFRLLVSAVKDYAILMLDPEGNIASWNAGAERIKGYRAEEIIRQHFSRFYLPQDVAEGKPSQMLELAAKAGRAEDEGWRVRKDGSSFWADVIITAIRDENGRLRGFGKVTRDLTEKRLTEEELHMRNAQLETANKELETFSYSVSHDLRAPLRAIDGFSLALLEDYESEFDEQGKMYLDRIRSGASRMARLIDDMLSLARISRAEMSRGEVNLSKLAEEVVSDLSAADPGRPISVSIAPNLTISGDRNLLRIALTNLLGNAWKFTASQKDASIRFGRTDNGSSPVFFVSDNGAGFDMRYADKLFGVFQRLHSDAVYPGTGVGLATVQRIIARHGGKIWAEAEPGKGATFYFTL